MCEYDGSLNHPQCFFHTRLTEEDIVEMIKKLTSEPLENYAKIGLKPFCLSNLAPVKGLAFWSRRPKVTVQKTTKPHPKKKMKSKGKAAAKESSVIGESRAGEEQSEEDDYESQDDVVEKARAQAKKRKTGDLSYAPKATEVFGMSTSVLELEEDPAATHDDLVDDIPDVRTDPSSPPKEVIENVNPPSSSKAAEDPDIVVVTGTSYSKPATTVLIKHASKETHSSAEQDITKLKLPNYEKIEFEQLCSGFVSRLETSYEMEKNLVNMMRIKHEPPRARSSFLKDGSGLEYSKEHQPVAPKGQVIFFERWVGS
ncbi:hypothetical protein ZWY2020_031878 [Hordeum vulgare]|nr:hypothetical protein ZWY2020_031878 [Hordeum vulgare]